jgi:hypothetical protein
MKLDVRGAAHGLLMMAFAVVIVVIKCRDDSSEFSASIDPLQKTKKAIRSCSGKSSEFRQNDERDVLTVIHNQFALLLSDRPEFASLDETLAACAKLNSASSIIDLLYHAELGWELFAPESGAGDSSKRSAFVRPVHDALFARWGELDFDGAIKHLRTIGRLGGTGDSDERWITTTHLFKGAAITDGRHALEVFDETTRFSPYRGFALGPLMEGWAKSDPEAAWQALTSLPIMKDDWPTCIQAYFNGLPADVSWSEMCMKVETICRAEQVIGDSSDGREFRRSLANAWGRDDLAGALGWYAPQCLAPHPSNCNEPPRTVLGQAEVIANWIKADPQGATRWLRDWHPTHVSTAQVYSKLSEMTEWEHRGYGSPEMKSAVQFLVRQP